MAKVLNSISLDAPASPVTASVNDTFEFTGTPGFTGGGGVQRYDFKWEVDDGGGFVTIGASGTGLITAGTNPVVNTNSQSANSITVTCDAEGSYTIRMAGAPTSGGSYTVLSATQTVEVSAGAETFQQAIAATAAGVAGVSKKVTYKRNISTTAVGVPVISRAVTYLRSISATAIGVAQIVKGSVFSKSISAVATGVASVTTGLVANVAVSATAVGVAALSVKMILAQSISATAVGVATVATEFIEGVGGRAIRFARGCIASLGRMMGR